MSSWTYPQHFDDPPEPELNRCDHCNNLVPADSLEKHPVTEERLCESCFSEYDKEIEDELRDLEKLGEMNHLPEPDTER